jgi:alpha-D-ribose 1-methylphosphonate 5-triphosphate diphosphatase PhnM
MAISQHKGDQALPNLRKPNEFQSLNQYIAYALNPLTISDQDLDDFLMERNEYKKNMCRDLKEVAKNRPF